MAENLTFNGSTYPVPNTRGETGWQTTLTTYLRALSTGALSKAGGSFTLTGEVDFGPDYGLKASYYKSRGASPATGGVVRAASGDTLNWKKFEDDGEVSLGMNSSNRVTFNGKVLKNEDDVIPVNRGGTNLQSYTAGDLPYASGATTIAKLGIGTNGQVLKSNGTAPTWGSAQSSLSSRTVAASGDITDTDDVVQASASGGGFTLQLLPASGIVGKSYWVKKIDTASGVVTVAASGSNTIDGAANASLNKENEAVQIVSDGTTIKALSYRKAPTIQKFLSGSGTYTKPNGALWLKVTLVGGGGGGGGGGSSGGTGGNGGNSTFGSSFLEANGGQGGVGNNGAGGAGGTVSLGTAVGIAVAGQQGCQGQDSPDDSNHGGGAAMFGGAGQSATAGAVGSSGVTNSGGGGQGGSGSGGNQTGGGGGGGGFVQGFVYNPSATYAYAVGAGGTAGTGSGGGGPTNGGAGGAGQIIVEEYY